MKSEKEIRINFYGKLASAVERNNEDFEKYCNMMLEAQKESGVPQDEKEAEMFAAVNVGFDAGFEMATGYVRNALALMDEEKDQVMDMIESVEV